MKTKFQTDLFHQFVVQKYGIDGVVPKWLIIEEIQKELNVDYARASILLLIMIGVNYFKEINDKIHVINNNEEHFDNSLIRYWMSMKE